MLNQLYSSVSSQSNAKIEELPQEDQNVKWRREKFQRQSSLLSKLTRQLSILDNRAAISEGSTGAVESPRAPKVASSGLVVFATQWNLSGFTKITLLPLSSGSPIINAGEIFGIFSLGGITSTRDVIALDRIKKDIQNPPVDWNGDPCLPREYSWSGVTCSEGSRIRVIALNLSGMGLVGSLSPSIANLTALTDLSFANNYFSGPIPELSQLQKLEKLHLQDNQITGIIPQSLGNIESLSELFLEKNNMTGKVPPNLIKKSSLTLRLFPGNNFS